MERRACERRRSRQGVFYRHRERTCKMNYREDRDDGGECG